MKKIFGFLFKGKRKFIVIPILLIALYLLVFGGKSSTPKYITMKLEEDTIKNTIISTGQSSVLKKSVLYSKTGGDVAEIYVKLGDKLKVGDPIMKLTNDDLSRQLQDLKIEKSIQENSPNTGISGAKLKYDQALKTYEDNKVLYNNGAVSSDVLSSSKSAKDSAYDAYKSAISTNNVNSLRLESINNKITRLEENIADLTIKSKLDAQISKLNFSIYDKVQPNQAVAEVEDSSVLEIVANINQFDAKKLVKNQPLKVYENKSNAQKYDASIYEISPSGVKSTNSQSSDTTIPIRVLFDNSKNVFSPNFPLKLEIITEQNDKALSVPYEAIKVKGDGKKYIYKVIDSVTKEVEVKYGIEGDTKVEVISDELHAGDIIVSKSDDKLQDAMTISVEESDD